MWHLDSVEEAARHWTDQLQRQAACGGISLVHESLWLPFDKLVLLFPEKQRVARGEDWETKEPTLTLKSMFSSCSFWDPHGTSTTAPYLIANDVVAFVQALDVELNRLDSLAKSLIQTSKKHITSIERRLNEPMSDVMIEQFLEDDVLGAAAALSELATFMRFHREAIMWLIHHFGLDDETATIVMTIRAQGTAFWQLENKLERLVLRVSAISAHCRAMLRDDRLDTDVAQDFVCSPGSLIPSTSVYWTSTAGALQLKASSVSSGSFILKEISGEKFHFSVHFDDADWESARTYLDSLRSGKRPQMERMSLEWTAQSPNANPTQVFFCAYEGDLLKLKSAVSVQHLSEFVAGDTTDVSFEPALERYRKSLSNLKPVVKIITRQTSLIHKSGSCLDFTSNVTASRVMPDTPVFSLVSPSPLNVTQLLVLPINVITVQQVNNEEISEIDQLVDELTSAPGFDLYTATISLLFPELGEKPPWQDSLIEKMCAKSKMVPTVSRVESENLRSGNIQQDSFIFDQESTMEPSAIDEQAPLLGARGGGGGNENRGNQANKRNEKMRPRSRRDPKVYWANERTLLSWLSNAIFLAITSVSLLTFGDQRAQIAGSVLVGVAISVAIYSLVRFQHRLTAISEGGKMSRVVDRWGPWVLVPLICVALVTVAVFSFLAGDATGST